MRREGDGQPLTRGAVALVLAVTGAMGFAVGLFVVPTWQDVIEPAQVLGGLVRYPSDSPLSLYSTRTWTLLQQIPAALLHAGLSERALALLLSGVTGLVSFQALGMTLLAIGRDKTLACVMPFFVFAAGATSGGLAYPVVLVGSTYTSGSIGMSFLLLVCALLGAGAYAGGALLLGLLPAMHATLGAWGLIIVALTLLWSDRPLRRQFWRTRYWFLAGAVISLASLLVHLWLSPSLAALPSDESRKYLIAVMTYWDQHRRPFARLSIQAAPFVIGVPFLAISLRRFRDRLPQPSLFLVRALLVSAALGLTLSVLLAANPMVFGGWLWRAMPSRLMNLPLLACMAAIIGVAGRLRDDLRALTILAALVVSLAVTAIVAPTLVAQASHLVMLASAVTLLWTTRLIGSDQPTPASMARRLRMLRVVVVTVPVVLMLISGVGAPTSFERGLKALADQTTDSLFATVRARPGLLLTASDLRLIQLRTRRAVLLDGAAIDGLAYVLEAAPATERILRDVYGVNLLNPPFPPRDARGFLTPDTGKDLWQARTVDEWRALGDRFDVTDVLTFSDWPLQLPEVARSGDLALFAIPR
ncbi:MAG: hypothetical protein EXQ59_01465 [Acidobacteria bacterium]|nr:hypothetical protein [Acidobacteriota bacterium]